MCKKIIQINEYTIDAYFNDKGCFGICPHCNEEIEILNDKEIKMFRNVKDAKFITNYKDVNLSVNCSLCEKYIQVKSIID